MPAPGVLIVDDDAFILRLCERILDRAGYSAVGISDPHVALQLLLEKPFDLLLVDILMPKMDGFELIKRARSSQAGIGVLVMTGFGTVETAIEALRRGVDGLILKPFYDAEDLLNAVQQACLLNQQKQDAGRLHALRPLLDVSGVLIAETNPDALMAQVLSAIIQLLQASHASIFYIQDPEGECSLAAQRGEIPWEKLINKRGLVRALLESNKHFYSISDKSIPVVIHQFLEKHYLRSAMCVQVWYAGRGLAFFAGRSYQETPFIESDYERFALLARQSAVAFENAGLYEELRRSLKRVEESQMALVQSEKMAAAGRLVASVAHEINNPLQAVRNCLHLVMHEDVSGDQKQAYLEMAHKEMNRLENTVKRMLDFYRPGHAEREWVEIKWVVNRVLQFLNIQLQKQEIEVDTNLPENLPKTFVIGEQLQQVILNILLNAIDALEDLEGDKHIWIDGVLDAGNLKIRIEDSGNGIPAGIRNRIFEPFFSSKEKGIGLGLAISYGFIEAQHGTLALVSGKHGAGACFEIVLPTRGTYGRRKNTGR